MVRSTPPTRTDLAERIRALLTLAAGGAFGFGVLWSVIALVDPYLPRRVPLPDSPLERSVAETIASVSPASSSPPSDPSAASESSEATRRRDPTGPPPGIRFLDGLFSDHRIALELSATDLPVALARVAALADLRLVLLDDLQGPVDVRFDDVPWYEALDVLARRHLLYMQITGTTIYVQDAQARVPTRSGAPPGDR